MIAIRCPRCGLAVPCPTDTVRHDGLALMVDPSPVEAHLMLDCRCTCLTLDGVVDPTCPVHA